VQALYPQLIDKGTERLLECWLATWLGMRESYYVR